jgi:hypothetical protein
MRHDFGFVRDGARRMQRRQIARHRLANMRRMRFSRRLAYAAIGLSVVAFPGRALFALVVPS